MEQFTQKIRWRSISKNGLPRTNLSNGLVSETLLFIDNGEVNCGHMHANGYWYNDVHPKKRITYPTHWIPLSEIQAPLKAWFRMGLMHVKKD